MKNFTIKPNNFLKQEINAYYHTEYKSGNGEWKIDGRIENIICTLKNDITPYSNEILNKAVMRLKNILIEDLTEISKQHSNLIVCVVPRAKVRYNDNQLLLKKTVSDVVDSLSYYKNGTGFISRFMDTKTTHKRSRGGNGRRPYPNITKDTCEISSKIQGEKILLIDDLYTKTINIDEDAIQALLDNGANSIIFYSIGAKLKL